MNHKFIPFRNSIYLKITCNFNRGIFTNFGEFEFTPNTTGKNYEIIAICIILNLLNSQDYLTILQSGQRKISWGTFQLLEK